VEKRVLIFTNHFYPEYFKINDVVEWFCSENITTTVITSNPNYPKGKIFKGFSILEAKNLIKLPLYIDFQLFQEAAEINLSYLSTIYLIFFLYFFLLFGL